MVLNFYFKCRENNRMFISLGTQLLPIFLFVFVTLWSFRASSQVTLHSEGFETDGEGTRYNSNTYYFTTPTCDFFTRMAASPLEPCFGGVPVNGFLGNYFWGSEDIMSSPGNRPPGFITSQSINTSGYTNLTISLYLATGNNVSPINTRWEIADSINVKVSFNAGITYTTVGRFMGNGVTGGDLINDLNLNGIADSGEPVVSFPTFTKYTFNIPGTGSTMQFQLDFDQLGGSEELGIDQIEVKGVAAPCPTFSGAPANVTINNSTCTSGCVVSGGSFTLPSGTPCPTGSTLQYSINGGAFTSTAPSYNQTGPVQSVVTRCTCNANPATFSASSTAVVTVPGSCTTPSAPTGSLSIVNSTCTACVLSAGSIAIGTVTGSGGTLEYSINGGSTWSATLPTYQITPITILASVLASNGCRSNSTSVGVTSPASCTPPAPPTGSLAIVNSMCTSCMVTGGSITIGSVTGIGGTIEYSTNGGSTWSATLPSYQTNPITILATVLGTNGCRSNSSLVGVTSPATCIPPAPPTGSLNIVNSACVNCMLTTGSISLGTVSGSGGTIEYSTNGGSTWSATIPTYQSSPINIIASVNGTNGCRSFTTFVGSTNPGVCIPPSQPSGSLSIVNSTCTGCMLTSGSISIGSVTGTGGTLEFSINGGTTWSSSLPTYLPTTIFVVSSVLASNGCRSFTSFVGSTMPGTCIPPAPPTGNLAIVNSSCTNCVLTPGSISLGNVSGSGGTVEYTTDGGMNWSASIPSYQSSPMVIGASVLAANGCRSNTVSVGFTMPSVCTTPSPPVGTLSIINSSCLNCTVVPGSVSIGSVAGSGGTLEYSTNGGMTWSSSLPGYDNNNPLTIQASVLSSNGCRSSMTMVGTTNPTVCVTPPPPMGSLAITNSTCINCILSGGSIAIGTVSGTGGTLEFSTNNGMTWSSSLPMYDVNNALTIHASILSSGGCRSIMTQVGVTAPGTCVAAVTIGSNCYTTVEAALAAVMTGQTIEIHVNINSLGNNIVPQGITVQINNGACWNNATTLTNNGTIQLVGTGKFINLVDGIYQGEGQMVGNLINQGVVKPGN